VKEEKEERKRGRGKLNERGQEGGREGGDGNGATTYLAQSLSSYAFPTHKTGDPCFHFTIFLLLFPLLLFLVSTISLTP